MNNIVCVVEGMHDQAKINTVFPKMEVLITNGSVVSEELLVLLEKLALTKKIVLCLDPDYAGERIRRIIESRVKNVYHIYVKKELAISYNKKKIGIEHMKDVDIIEAFKHIKYQQKKSLCDVDEMFLYEHGLKGKSNSQNRRNILSKTFNFGHVNGKNLLKRLLLFDIKKEDIIEALNEETS